MFAETTHPTGDGTACEIRLAEMIVTADYVDESPQPWGEGRTCYRYIVRVSAADSEGEMFQEYAYGSQVDYENGENTKSVEMAWMILDDLISAYNDPEEFFYNATAGGEEFSLEKVRGVLSVIDFAEKIGRVLEINESDIYEARENL